MHTVVTTDRTLFSQSARLGQFPILCKRHAYVRLVMSLRACTLLATTVTDGYAIS